MKEFFIRLQAGLMEVILISLIICLGILTAAGFVFSLAAVFTYLGETHTEKWKSFFRWKFFFQTVGIEIAGAAAAGVLGINFVLIPQLPPGIRLIVLSLSILMSIFCFLIAMVTVWLMGNQHRFSITLLKQALTFTVVNLPIWLVYSAFSFLCIIFLRYFPIFLILIPGINLLWFNRLMIRLLRRLKL